MINIYKRRYTQRLYHSLEMLAGKSMYMNLVLVLLISVVVLGDQSCDRKEMEDTICSLCTQRRGGPTGQQIAFFAYMSKNVPISSLSKYKAFVYDHIETNVGNGYSASTGKFTAPEGGVYVFHTTTPALDKSHSIVEIVKNGEIKDIAWADAMDHNDRAVSSTMTILNLKKGDVVHARVGVYYGGNLLESNNLNRMSFSGFKLA